MSQDTCRYDIKGLQQELEIDISDLATLFSSYINEMQSEIAELYKYLSDGDFNMLQRVVHNIKGVSANLWIEDVQKLASDFGDMLKRGDTFESGSQISLLLRTINEAQYEIRKYFSQYGYSL